MDPDSDPDPEHPWEAGKNDFYGLSIDCYPRSLVLSKVGDFFIFLYNYKPVAVPCRPIKINIYRYDYGSPGILEYYQHKLLDIVQYPDARTELFHNFRYYKIPVIVSPRN